MRIVVLIPIFLTCSVFAQVLVCDEEHFRNPQPHGIDLLDVDSSRFLYVAVGERGILQTSPNGVFWDIKLNLIGVKLNAVKYMGDLVALPGWLAVGEFGYMYYSSDGVTWNFMPTFPQKSLRDVLVGNGEIFVIGEIAQVYQGGNWNDMVISPNRLNAGIYFNGEFHLVGDSHTYLKGPSVFNLTSVPTTLSTNFKAITTDNSWIYILDANNSVVRFDGSNWDTLFTFSQPMRSINHSTGGFLCMGENGSLFSSNNGIQWQAVPSQTNQHLNGVAYGNTSVIVGSGGAVLTSTNLTDWTRLNTGMDLIRTHMMRSGSSLFLMSEGQGTAYKSQDGFNWQMLNGDFSDIQAIHEFAGGFVAVGPGKALFSSDGLNWSPTPFSASGLFRRVVGWNVLVAVFDNEIAYSTNGTTWSSFDPGFSSNLISVCQGPNGRFVAVGANGLLVYSDDGLQWTQATDSGLYSGGFLDVAYGNGLYVAVGQESTIAVSPDGNIWSVIHQNSGLDFFFGTVIYEGNTFWALEKSYYPVLDTLWSSKDGLEWTEQKKIRTRTYDLATVGDSLLACGYYGNWVAYRDIGSDLTQWPQIDILTLVPLIDSCGIP
ncbi:MAG: hypothetical protein H6510_05170 [Acidobacteria bacterium]|nr:hypothetical protein [Acidobacteriota bacterium]MCB9397185.1 hypothetical protein [Acidobacteriota bacterium]